MSDRFSFLIIKLSIRAAPDSAQVSYKYKVQLLYRLFAWGCSCWKWIYWACWQKDILFDKSCYAVFDAYHMSCVAWHHNSQTVRARKLNFQRIGPLGQFFLCVEMFVCLSVCPWHFFLSFNGLFTPTSQSSMSKLFRYSESLRKSNKEKWSQI